MKSDVTLPDLIVRDGKAIAVILPIEEYREMLEDLEDVDGLKALETLYEKPLKIQNENEVLELNAAKEFYAGLKTAD